MILFGQLLFGKCFSKWLLVYFWRENLPPLEEFHLDLHGSDNFLFLLIDLNRVCIKIIKLAPNVPNSYLFNIYSQIYSICLDNKCYNYIYYVFIHVFIEIFGVYCGLCLY